MKDKDLEQSIKAKIRQIAEQQGKLFNEVWQMLALERFLVRLACSPHKDKFIFKVPQLRNVAGVTDINSMGGFEKQYVVAPNLERLGAYGLSLADVVNALEKNNANKGAGYIERTGEQYLVRAPGQVQSMDDISAVIIGTAQGQPIRVRDVASVELGRELRTGAEIGRAHV